MSKSVLYTLYSVKKHRIASSDVNEERGGKQRSTPESNTRGPRQTCQRQDARGSTKRCKALRAVVPRGIPRRGRRDGLDLLARAPRGDHEDAVGRVSALYSVNMILFDTI